MSRYSAGFGPARRVATGGNSNDADSIRINASTSLASSALSRYCETSSRPATNTTNTTSTTNKTSTTNTNTNTNNDARSESNLVRTFNSTSLNDCQSSKCRPAGFSVVSHVTGSSQRDTPAYASPGFSVSKFYRDGADAGSTVGGTHSRVAGYQAPRPFHTSAPGSVQQQSDTVALLEKQLETDKQENLKLQQEVDAKDKRIDQLQKEIELLNKECDDLDIDNMQLQEENRALIRAMSKLNSTS